MIRIKHVSNIVFKTIKNVVNWQWRVLNVIIMNNEYCANYGMYLTD